MTEPTIICPKCKAEIKLTESLAAPLIEATRKEYEWRLLQKDAEFDEREKALQVKEAELAKARGSLDEQLAEKLKLERSKIAAEEAKKARLVAATDLEEKAREIDGLQEILKKRDEKLAEAQKEQADLLRQKRELEDAKREISLTVEKRVQEGLAATRKQALKEAEEQLQSKVAEKEQAINLMQKQLDEFKRKDAELAKRESSLHELGEEIAKAREAIDDQVAERLRLERTKIAEDEARKARLAASTDIEQKAREIADLQEVLITREEKLAEAQKEQADLLRQKRELEDAKREIGLTVEKRVQEGLDVTRKQALKEAEEQLHSKVAEKDQAITLMQRQLDEFKRKDAELAKRESSLHELEEEIAKAREAIDDQVAERLRLERSKIAEEEARKAKLVAAADVEEKSKEIADLQGVLKLRDEKLAEAQKEQAELLRKQRELDDAKRELDLTVEKRIQEGLDETREKARKEAEELLKFKVMEKEQTITAMQRQIEDLKRRAEQGSQQLQGEVQELELEGLLAAKFPVDSIEPVPKGVHGGDVIHRVNGPLGQSCGTILWESKRTKNWSDGWLIKLREDQRVAKAEIAVIVSQALPKDVDTFELIDGVWVTHPRAALPVAVTLRHTLLEVSLARQSSEGQQTKMEMVYQYLTGPRFRQRVQAIVEAFSTMQEDLDKEKRAITKQWAKREEQIERVMGATVGMYGDLQGIAGKTLQEIEGLNLLSAGE